MFLEQLNEQQFQAATSAAHAVSIVAGPGTGKTKTLTARIAHLLTNDQVAPGELVALTFTNKAAQEIRERVAGLVNSGVASSLRITTFHGLCYQLLQKSRKNSLTLIPETDRLALVGSLQKPAAFKGMAARELLTKISQAKGRAPDATPPIDTATSQLLQTYTQALATLGLVDFDDLLLQAYKLLTDVDQSPIRHLLLDEFQDTSELQYHLLRRLRPENLFVIGDPLQSIYGFRGASGEVFDWFNHDFPRAERITLTTNYRSAPAIVTTGNAIFPIAPQLRPNRNNKGVCRAIEVLNEYSEAEWVIGRIEAAIGGSDFLRSHQAVQDETHHCTFRDFAILYRTHRVATTVQRLLGESGLPYYVVGEGSPYEQPRIKAIIAILRWLADPTDQQLQKLATTPLLKGFSQRQLRILLTKLQNQSPDTPSLAAHRAIEIFQLQTDKPALMRDLNQFMSSLVQFDKQGMLAYLKHLDDTAEQNFYDPSANAITLLTIHAAKGLEFGHVFLVGTEEGLLPHRRPGADPDIVEEKRLFYVAVTRAQNQLDIVHARTRNGVNATVSQFVTSLPASVLPRIIDPALAMQAQRANKRRQKRSQLGLFG